MRVDTIWASGPRLRKDLSEWEMRGYKWSLVRQSIGFGVELGHPAGPAAGARAFRQAIDAVMAGVKVSDYAEEDEELKTALTKWGGGRTGFQM